MVEIFAGVLGEKLPVWQICCELKVYQWTKMDRVGEGKLQERWSPWSPLAERRHPKIFVLEAQLPDDPLLQLWQGFVVILLRQGANVRDLGSGDGWQRLIKPHQCWGFTASALGCEPFCS